MSRLVVPLVALLYIDDTNLYVFNSSFDSTKEVVKKAQNLLNTWHEVLKVIGDDLKLSKCYWTLCDYQQRNRKYTLVVNIPLKLSIDTNKLAQKIQYLKADQIRTLVGVPKNPLYKLAQITEIYDMKMIEYITKLNTYTLGP